IAADHFYWDFGDGSGVDSVTVNPVHTYASKGDYNVSLSTINDVSGCDFLFSSEAKVRDLKANFSIDTSYGCAGLFVNFDASASVDTSIFNYIGRPGAYIWIYGDGASDFLLADTAAHTFSSRGDYNVQLIVKDINSCTDTAEQFIKIYEPVPGFAVDNSNGCSPLTVNFTDTTITDTTITEWRWEFGDYTSLNSQNPIHMYGQPGEYTVYFRVTNILGCSKSITKEDFIFVTIPFPSFYASDLSLCTGDIVDFIN
ncbi:unnamed protein product, partial [marine sediment metagenome]